jgi:hypothetical protein
MADNSDIFNLHSTQSGHCYVCEALMVLFSSVAFSPAPQRNFADDILRLISATNIDIARSTPEAPCQYLDNQGAWQTDGVFMALRSLDWVSLFIPIMLNTIHLGILKQLMNWEIPFLKHHNQMD